MQLYAIECAVKQKQPPITAETTWLPFIRLLCVLLVLMLRFGKIKEIWLYKSNGAVSMEIEPCVALSAVSEHR